MAKRKKRDQWRVEGVGREIIEREREASIRQLGVFGVWEKNAIMPRSTYIKFHATI